MRPLTLRIAGRRSATGCWRQAGAKCSWTDPIVFSRCAEMTRTARQALGATFLYLVATCAMTWPLIKVMHREVASDMGDPVLNCWILLWTSGQVLAFFSGDFGALSRYWDGNIFYPEPLTIAYSEHLTGQMVQALPVLAATDNAILAYNL